MPALFWLIPVGQWDPRELERLWYHFTEKSSRCNELGLMLVKNSDRWNIKNDSRQNSDLSDLTGKLSDMLPSGVRTIYDNEYLSPKEKKNQVLIVSGSYPQPGWGVLLSLNNYHDIEKLLENTLGQIDLNLRSIFIEASYSFKTWDAFKRNRPLNGDVEVLKKKKEICIELCSLLESVLSEISAEHLNDYNFVVLKKRTSEGYYKEFSEDISSLFEMTDDKFILSLLILKALKDTKENEINSTLMRFLSEHNSKTNNLFKSEKNNELKKVASLLLRLDEVGRPIEKFILWANNTYNAKINIIKKIVGSLINKYQFHIGTLVLSIERLDSNYNTELLKWQEKVESYRLSFHKNLQNVLNSHLEYGPIFLLNIEKQTRIQGIFSKSISWDPARMVGWKLLAEGIKFARFDITTHLRGMVSEFSIQFNDETNNDDTLVNGSLFTDYVHYISLKDPNLSPRNATKKLLEGLILPVQIREILKNSMTNISLKQTHSQMVESLIVEFGWPSEKFNNDKKLADCIIENEGGITINKSFTGNDIRIIFENYCKDLANTLASKTGFTATELFDLVTSRHPKYKSQHGDWNYDIDKLTIGSAYFILSALFNATFPDKKESSNNFIQNLNSLRSIFNDLSHDPPLGDTSQLVDGIVAILKYTKELVSEMPWHFYPVQRNGYQPTILTGNAWSHSYKENRQLSIILWSNEISSESMLVWNPSKVNPVIPDGIIINRPQR